MQIDKHILSWLETNSNAMWLITHFFQAFTSTYYGKITVQFEAGNIILLRKEQTQKPPKFHVELENAKK